MGKQLVEQIRDIESQADEIVAGAQRKAKDTEGSIPSEVTALRKERQEALQRDVESFQADLARRTDEELAALDRKAAWISKRLDEIEPGTLAPAVDLILKHLRGE